VQNFKSQWQRIRNFQRSEQVLLFIQQNGLYTVEQLADKITELHQAQYDLAGDVKKKERRITTLTEHLAQVERYYKLSDYVNNAEALRRGAEYHMREIVPERELTRAWNMVL